MNTQIILASIFVVAGIISGIVFCRRTVEYYSSARKSQLGMMIVYGCIELACFILASRNLITVLQRYGIM